MTGRFESATHDNEGLQTMADFDPVSAAAGGALIGLAAVLLMLLNGRIAGVSGILGDMLALGDDAGWRIAFLVGLIAAPLAATLAGHPLRAPLMPRNWALAV